MPAQEHANTSALDFLKTLSDDTSRYMFLSRLQMDANAFCHIFCNSYGNERHLFAGNVPQHIECMRYLWDILEPKPEWLTMEQLNTIAEQMQQIPIKQYIDV